jgi:RNA-directed DNA polymerase
MNGAQMAVALCAPSHKSLNWNQIDWAKCERFVRRLQARIVKSIQQGRWGKVQALQRLLTHSFCGRALAVKRVTENKGKRTSGVDRVLWSTPDSKIKAMDSLHGRGYSPQPLRRIYIPKSNGKLRPLGIPTMKDRAMQALYLLGLLPVAETLADRNSYGFRPERSTHDALAQCFSLLSQKRSPQWILEGDIKGCFDHISHDWMLKNIPMNRGILSQWLKAGYVENRTLFPTQAGTPQGGIISPTLANMTLDGLERLLKDRFPITTQEGVRHNPKVHLVRYADDFIITAKDKLVLSPEKTAITHINDGFDFLGQNVRKYDDKLLIKPSKKNTLACLEKVRQIIQRAGALDQAQLIYRLNPILRGWSNYHRHGVSKRTFGWMDHAVRNCLWFWAKRRHANKSKGWIENKYWSSFPGRSVFAADTGKRTEKGQTVWTKLMCLGQVRIVRFRRLRISRSALVFVF